MEKLTSEELNKKYENIEDKIPVIWDNYEAAGIELAQDLSFDHWDISNAEMIRVISLVSIRVPGLQISQHINPMFTYKGLYPEIMKEINIWPDKHEMEALRNYIKTESKKRSRWRRIKNIMLGIKYKIQDKWN